jgi:hypothetical protein
VLKKEEGRALLEFTSRSVRAEEGCPSGGA